MRGAIAVFGRKKGGDLGCGTEGSPEEGLEGFKEGEGELMVGEAVEELGQ